MVIAAAGRRDAQQGARDRHNGGEVVMLWQRVQRWAVYWAELLALVAFGNALFLTFAILMPNWLARTSWSRANRIHDFISAVDSPASYVGFVSLWGLVAFLALAVGLWRWRAPAAAIATIAFAAAAYVVGNFWYGLSQGVVLSDGHRVLDMVPPKWEVHWPPLMPVFLLSAIVGAVSALGLTIAWRRQPQVEQPEHARRSVEKPA
jgi:hypothetical protein